MCLISSACALQMISCCLSSNFQTLHAYKTMAKMLLLPPSMSDLERRFLFWHNHSLYIRQFKALNVAEQS